MKIEFSRFSFRVTRSWGMRLLAVWVILISFNASFAKVWDLVIAAIGIAAAVLLLQER